MYSREWRIAIPASVMWVGKEYPFKHILLWSHRAHPSNPCLDPSVLKKHSGRGWIDIPTSLMWVDSAFLNRFQELEQPNATRLAPPKAEQAQHNDFQCFLAIAPIWKHSLQQSIPDLHSKFRNWKDIHMTYCRTTSRRQHCTKKETWFTNCK